jgi:adenylosuccinate synthase
VTGRPRRCGWFDAVATKYTAEINGFSTVALTKLDVLDALDEIKVCTGYKLNGEVADSFPAIPQAIKSLEPIYTTLQGWKTSTVGITDFDALPEKAREYVEFLSKSIGVEIGLISTGPERDQTLIMKDSTLGIWLG